MERGSGQRNANRQIEMRTGKQRGKQEGRNADRQAGRQVGRQARRQADRPKHKQLRVWMVKKIDREADKSDKRANRQTRGRTAKTGKQLSSGGGCDGYSGWNRRILAKFHR